MNNKVTAYPAEYSKEIAVLRKQLAISLKFHHTGTLQKLPVEVAVHVMAEVWAACNHNEAANGTNRISADG